MWLSAVWRLCLAVLGCVFVGCGGIVRRFLAVCLRSVVCLSINKSLPSSSVSLLTVILRRHLSVCSVLCCSVGVRRFVLADSVLCACFSPCPVALPLLLLVVGCSVLLFRFVCLFLGLSRPSSSLSAYRHSSAAPVRLLHFMLHNWCSTCYLCKVLTNKILFLPFRYQIVIIS